ncbi:hypothetical protein RB195_026152 [Necator americanus]|uniref:Uncharacterized protein n=1 Tax=Necator americanus TaxID=51031 RepID=A0ABR1EVN6_NECAM
MNTSHTLHDFVDSIICTSSPSIFKTEPEAVLCICRFVFTDYLSWNDLLRIQHDSTVDVICPVLLTILQTLGSANMSAGSCGQQKIRCLLVEEDVIDRPYLSRVETMWGMHYFLEEWDQDLAIIRCHPTTDAITIVGLFK